MLASLVIACSWNEAGELVLTSEEHGGLPGTPPARRGFGAIIIKNSVPYKPGGAATVDYRPAGVRDAREGVLTSWEEWRTRPDEAGHSDCWQISVHLV